MNPIRNPFSRDAYPALTDAITGVVNGQPRQVEEEITPKRMKVLDRAVKTGMAGSQTGFGTLANAQSRALADRASLAITRAHATKGGKKVTGFAKAKREHEAAKARHRTLKTTPAGFNRSGGVVGEQVTNIVNESHSRSALEKLSITQLRALLKKYTAKPGNGRELADIRGLLRAKGAGVVVDEAVTPAQRGVFARERERMLGALNNPNTRLSPTEREAVLARGQRNAAAEVRKGAVSPSGDKSPIHAAAKAHHEYARRESKKLDAIVKRKSK